MPDWNRVAPGLYIGSRAPTGDIVRRHGFDVLVLCAEEHQPPDHKFPGVEVFRCPFGDVRGPMDPRTAKMIYLTADRAARRLLAGKRVLVTCQAGLNRSGLVTALTLHVSTGRDPMDCVRQVRRSREVGGVKALFNEDFVRILRRYSENNSASAPR